MFRLRLRLALVPLLFLSAVLLFIRAQTYDNHEIQTFLRLDGCSVPCFMGIQPGVTSPQQALSQLRSSDLISHVGVSEELETVAWFWDKKRSPLMDDTQIPALFYNQNEVSTIRLYTRIQLGDVLLQLDQMRGSHRIAISRTVPYDTFHVDLYYLGNGYVLNTVVNCRSFWTQPTHLILGASPQFFENQGRITTSLNTAKHLIAMACRRRHEG